jgi:hypothetical protein
MSAPEDVAGVVQTAADEFKKMMDTLAGILEKMNATEEAAKAAQVQKDLLDAIKDLKAEVAGLKEKPGGLTPGKLDLLQKEGGDLAECVKNPAAWKDVQPGIDARKMGKDGPLGLAKGALKAAEGPVAAVQEAASGLGLDGPPGGGPQLPGWKGALPGMEGGRKMGSDGPLGQLKEKVGDTLKIPRDENGKFQWKQAMPKEGLKLPGGPAIGGHRS